MPDSERHDGGFLKMEILQSLTQKMNDEIQKLALKVKHHEDNLKFLESQINNIDVSILDFQVELGKYHSSKEAEEKNNNIDIVNTEQQTIEQILLLENTAAGVICQMKVYHGLQASKLPLIKDVLGIVATLGKVTDDNLSRVLSEFLGLETMLAIVCKTHEGVKALEKYLRSSGLFFLGERNDVEIKFPVSFGMPSLHTKFIECQEQIKLMNWKKERVVEDKQREETLLNQAKQSYIGKKNELLELLKCNTTNSI